MKNDKYLGLCIKSVTGDISPEEKNELSEWINLSSENRSFYGRIAAVWQKSDMKMPALNYEIDDEWDMLKKDLGLEIIPDNCGKEKTRSLNLNDIIQRFFKPRLIPAYAIFASIIIIFILANPFRQHKLDSVLTTLTTTYHQQSEYYFSDGSYVYLNSGSSIKFLSTFSDTLREVFLTGEGYFKVTKDKRPFVVNTVNSKTRVLGTEFSIWTRGEKTRIIVKSGKVHFSSKENQEKGVELVGNQMSCADEMNPPVSPKNVNADRLLGWLKGRFVFEKANVHEIVDELERSYGITILIQDSSIETMTVTADFDTTSIETIFSSLCYALGVQYKIENEVYILY